MKKVLFLLLLGSLFAFSACKSDKSDDRPRVDATQKMTDLELNPAAMPTAATTPAPKNDGFLTPIPAHVETLRAQVTPDTPDDGTGLGGIAGIWQWISANSAKFTGLVLGALALFEAIVRLTPSENDNSIFNKIKRFFDLLFPNQRTSGGLHP